MDTRFQVVAVETGVYEVGSDHIASARPRHRRLIDKTFWIDIEPLSVDDFTAFVLGDGYNRPELWPLRRRPEPLSVDNRCRHLRQASNQQFEGKTYVTGLNWDEASAIAAYFKARLPFEIEWEIAATAQTPITMPDVLEWTADVFSPVYWRADYAKRGDARPNASPGEQRTARGHLPDALVRDVAARRGMAPGAPTFPCGLRRVWDTPPPGAHVR